MRGGERPPVALTLKTEGTSGKPPAKKTVTFKLDAPTTSPIPRKSPNKGARQQRTASHDTKAHLAQRPYLSKPTVHLPTSPPVTSQPSQPTTPPPTYTYTYTYTSYTYTYSSSDDTS